MENIVDSVRKINHQFNEDIKELDLDKLFVKYLGKKGEINKLLAEIRLLSQESKIEPAKEINELKKVISEKINEIKANSDNHGTFGRDVDFSVPVKPSKTGNLHPITSVTRDLNQFFHYYGFSVFDGPEIEDDLHNFEMLGVPADHPARELQDTLYILEPEFLLRTQTSSIEARELKRQDPPIRFVFGGKSFRNETANKSNGSLFHQYQGVCVDKNITMGNLKWIFSLAIKHILGDDTEIRFRAKYYPEVEPGLSPDFKCKFCNGKGCDFCKQRGWIEAAGGGMIHPKTLEMAGINPKEYSGLAFGFGLDRLAMSKFDIRDIRVLFNSSIIYK